ncbi:MAG: hypothetical protein KAW39_06720, partial [Thermoplasmata archaeon]|nr:hypothetical protein [Thermoplasmata archaeon]
MAGKYMVFSVESAEFIGDRDVFSQNDFIWKGRQILQGQCKSRTFRRWNIGSTTGCTRKAITTYRNGTLVVEANMKNGATVMVLLVV